MMSILIALCLLFSNSPHYTEPSAPPLLGEAVQQDVDACIINGITLTISVEGDPTSSTYDEVVAHADKLVKELCYKY